MPFPFDLSQVFWGLMNKTMWDCKFGNFNGFCGFNGGFMNSCWGGGFQMPGWGDSYSFSSSGSSSTGGTPEERVAKRKAQDKYNTLKGVIKEYISKLTSSADKDKKMLLEEKLKDCGSSYSESNYEKLTELYDEYKSDIQKKVKNNTKIEVSSTSKTAANEFARTSPDFTKILKTDSDNKTIETLKDDVDAMEFLYSLQTTKKKSFKALYEEALNGADTTKQTEMKKVLQAVYKGLTKEALAIRTQDGLSEDTKAILYGPLLESISDDQATADNVDQLYYYIRLAKAEIVDNKYADLREDFPDDPLFGKSEGVTATTNALKTKEGMDVDNIPKQTAVTNFDEMENDTERMQKLEAKKYVTALTQEQLGELNSIEGVEALGITKAWVDNASIYSYQEIRFIDNEGNMCSVTGVGMKNGKIQKITGSIGKGQSVTSEVIQQRAKTLSEIEAATDTLVEITSRRSSQRVFEEKNITGDRNYKRLFIVDNEGNLKEWKSAYYDRTDNVFRWQDSEVYNDITLSDIKAAAANGRSHKGMSNQELVNLVKSWREVDKTDSGLKIYGKEYSGNAHVTKSKFSEAYSKDSVIALHVVHDTKGNDWGDANVKEKISGELTKLANHIIDALYDAGLEDSSKLIAAANTVIKKYVENVYVVKDDKSDDNNNNAKYTSDKIQKSSGDYRHRIVDMRDTEGINSNAYMVSFKDFVDDILDEYKRLI